MKGDKKENKCKFAIVKRILLLIGILLSVSPNLVLANIIILDQEWGRIEDWDERKHIVGDDLYVYSHVKLSLSKVFYNYSNNYTFIFSPFESEYTKEPISYSIRIFRDCNHVSLQNFPPPIINCEQGKELTEGIDFQGIEMDQGSNWEPKAYEIRIFQNESFREWVSYDILISYKLEKFVKRKGSDHYFLLSKACQDIKSKKWCPPGDRMRVTIFFTDPSSKLEKYSDCAEKFFLSGEGEYLWTEGRYINCEIRFSNVKETETWIPLKWATIGAFIGYILGVSINWIRNQVVLVLKIIWPLIKNRFRGRRIPNRKKKGKYKYTYNPR